MRRGLTNTPYQYKETMFSKTLPSLLLAITSLGVYSAAHAAKFSDLQVVQEAAQAGQWTMTTSGTLPDGTPYPARTETVCATKQDVLESMNSSFTSDTSTGVDDKQCPTTLSTNTSTLGVATLNCKIPPIKLPGQKAIVVPDVVLKTEFKRTGKQTWTVKTGNVVTNITYHGTATASCMAARK